MISLNDLFSSEIGNEFVFDSPLANETQVSTYVPSDDIQPLTVLSTDNLSSNDVQTNAQAMKGSSSLLLFPITTLTSNEDKVFYEDNDEVFDDSINEAMIVAHEQSDCIDANANMDEIRKHNHSQIEKRRREKMNLYIQELANLVPMCNAMPSTRKLDKLTVLRMTVQHIKAIKNSAALSDSVNRTPSFIPEQIIAKLLFQVGEGFIFVVSCDRAKILYVSESVKQTLNYSQRDLLGISWFDVLHPKDIPKVKEQLSLWDIAPKEKLVDAKTLLPLNANMAPTTPTRIQACPGARRSFFCRMKYKTCLSKKDGIIINGLVQAKRRRINATNKKYCDLHCMGYLKSWTPVKQNNEELECENNDNSNTGCLVAMARVMPYISTPDRECAANQNFPIKPIEYTSRHSMDGLYLFVDQRMTPILGYLPQELLGTSCYDYCHRDDIKTLAESHRRALQQNEKKPSSPFRFKTKIGTYIYLQTIWKVFKNPWTQEFEYMIAINENIATPDFDSIKNNNNCISNLNSRNIETINKINKGINDENENKNKNNTNNRSENQSLCSSRASSDDMLPSSSSSGDSHKSPLSSDSAASISQVLSTSSSIMKRFIKNKIKHSKVGQQIAEEILEAQRRADDFSSSSSQSSDSPPSSLDTGNGSVNSSLSGNCLEKPMHSTYGMKTPSPLIIQSLATDSGIESTNYDSLSLPSFRDASNSSLTDISSLEPLSTNNSRFINSFYNPVNQQMNNSIINSETRTQQNDQNEESDEAAMALIMSILEADAGLGGPVDFSGMPWPLY